MPRQRASKEGQQRKKHKPSTLPQHLDASVDPKATGAAKSGPEPLHEQLRNADAFQEMQRRLLTSEHSEEVPLPAQPTPQPQPVEPLPAMQHELVDPAEMQQFDVPIWSLITKLAESNHALTKNLSAEQLQRLQQLDASAKETRAQQKSSSSVGADDSDDDDDESIDAAFERRLEEYYMLQDRADSVEYMYRDFSEDKSKSTNETAEAEEALRALAWELAAD